MSESETKKNIKTFISGGIAGSVAKTIVAPIDRVKILLQAHSKHYENVRILNSFSTITRKEGFLSLYKGNGAQLLRIFPYAAIQFTSFEFYKSSLLAKSDSVDNQKQLSFLHTLLCGSLAGITAVTCTYPLDVIRSRLAYQFKGEEKYAGIVDCIKKIYNENSKKTLKNYYRGYTITILGMIPYAGLSFSIYDKLKHLIINFRLPSLSTPSSLDHNNKYELTISGRLICGGLTGALSQTITYPLDVIRRYMQLNILGSSHKSIRHTFNYILNNYGIRHGFYKGITLNYLRAIPMVSTSFCFYELSKKLFGLETGILIKLN